ncbi:MAG: type II 3-dehydroquinate dehydratase [Lachnospiraceae bacterium]|nr:type II 3-dehydroquinate dehydratase [Lachnospiraceae bacterium]
MKEAKIIDLNGRFGLVGEKLGHSFSPVLHEKFGSYRYDLIEVPKDEIDHFFEAADFDGVNVTIPYKEKAVLYCRPDENAASIGCVNTLVRSGDGTVYGYNTDTFGFEYMLKRSGIDVAGKKTVILGSGGTCRTAAYTLSRLGCGEVYVVSRHPKDMGFKLKCPVSYVSYDEIPADCRIMVNTTPLGMYPGIDGAAIDISESYVNLEAVVDVIYNPLRTCLVLQAIDRGIKACGGLSMLVAQGFFASLLFSGIPLGDDPVSALKDTQIAKLEEVIACIEKTHSNIVLTGMPGSGKSTVGRLAATRLGLDFSDTDAVFAQMNGMGPGDFIRKEGEARFRALESEAVRSVCLTGGRVIATGGGVVLDPRNIERLRHNGTIIFLNRRLSDLATEGRPLSEGSETLKALYYNRLPIYLSTCDLTIDVRGGADEVCDEVCREVCKEAGIYAGGDARCGLHKSKKEKHMKILVINGPNLNMLGIREPDIYGRDTYDDLLRMCREKAGQLGAYVEFYQSNHEGDLVDIIQEAYGRIDGIVINPGAYTHTSVAILDALKTVGIPAVEVHISDVDRREDFRQISYISSYVIKTIKGHGLSGYTEAMDELVRASGSLSSGN